jgi:hypothetical protein
MSESSSMSGYLVTFDVESRSSVFAHIPGNFFRISMTAATKSATTNTRDKVTAAATPAEAPDPDSSAASFGVSFAVELTPFLADRLRPTVTRGLAVGNGNPETIDVDDGFTLPVSVGVRLIVPNGVSERVGEWDRVAVGGGDLLVVPERDLVTVGVGDRLIVAEKDAVRCGSGVRRTVAGRVPARVGERGPLAVRKGDSVLVRDGFSRGCGGSKPRPSLE